MAHTCPSCGHSFTSTRTARRLASPLPERSILDRQFQANAITKDTYFAECKRIGLRDDLRFLIRVAGADLRGALRAEASALLAQLETRAGKATDAKSINSIRDRYRVAKGSLIVRSAHPRPMARKRLAA